MRYPQKEEEYADYEPTDDMPVIPPGEEGTPGDTLDDTTSVQEELYQTTWKEEAKQIPLDQVSQEERDILTAFLNDEPTTIEEQEKLEKTLAKYRPFIQKHNPQETLKNIDHNLGYNKAEKSFLDILKQQKKEKTLTMNYPLDDGTTYQLHLNIKRSDSQSITDLQTNFKLFEDLTPREDHVRIKQQQGIQLTREEQIILDNINKKINEKVMSNQHEMMVEFLSTHTNIQGEEHDYKYMKQVYETMDRTYLEQLFAKVSRISGLTNPDVDELFQ